MGAECYLSISPSVSMEELLDAASTHLPTLRGLKYTDYNLMELGRCLSGNGGKYQVLYGRDEVCVCVCVCVYTKKLVIQLCEWSSTRTIETM